MTIPIPAVAVAILLISASAARPQEESINERLDELRSEEQRLERQLLEVQREIRELQEKLPPPAESHRKPEEWSFLASVLGTKVTLQGSSPLRKAPTAESEEVEYLVFGDAVSVVEYGRSGWWKVRVECENLRSADSLAQPCEISGYLPHRSLETPLSRIGVDVPTEFLFPAHEAPQQVRLRPNERITPHRDVNRALRVRNTDSGYWDLLGVVGSGALAKYKVRRENVVGWVSSHAIEAPPLNELEPYLYAIKERHQREERAVRERFSDLLIHYVHPKHPNSAGGVDVAMSLEVRNERTLKYLTLTLTAFNPVGDAVRGSIHGQSTRKLRFTGPLARVDGTETVGWETVWYNSTISCTRLDRLDVEYMNGSSYTYIRELPKVLHPDFKNRC